MWTLKIQASVTNTIVGGLAKKHGVIVQLYPLLSNRVKDQRLITYSGTTLGDEQNVKRFLRALGSLPQIENLEVNGNTFVGRYREKAGYDHFYNPEIIYIEPWTIDGNKGTHSLHLGSWKRDHLNKIINVLGKQHNGKLLRIVKTKHPSIFLFNIRPHLTERQREAMELAVKHGYYDCPRKTSVQDLAKIAKRAFSTFQVHLRNAERKIIPFSYNNDTYR